MTHIDDLYGGDQFQSLSYFQTESTSPGDALKSLKVSPRAPLLATEIYFSQGHCYPWTRQSEYNGWFV
jgi:hypothetical protein